MASAWRAEITHPRLSAQREPVFLSHDQHQTRFIELDEAARTLVKVQDGRIDMWPAIRRPGV
jgi:hypothetical protein